MEPRLILIFRIEWWFSFYFFLDWKYPFWVNFLQTIQIVSLSWNLLPRLFQIFKIRCWCSFSFWTFFINFNQNINLAFWSYLINLRLFAETWRQWPFLFTSRRPNRYHQAVSWLFQALFFVKTEEIQKKLQQDTNANLKHYGKQEKYLLHRKQQYKGRTPWSEKMFILATNQILK